MNDPLPLHDIVHASEFNLYKLKIPDNMLDTDISDLDLSFDLIPYYGDVDLFVNPDVAFDNLTLYMWNSTENQGLESLSFSLDEIEVEPGKKFPSIFYIAVYGNNMTSTYKLNAYIADVRMRYLVFDCTETGYI